MNESVDAQEVWRPVSGYEDLYSVSNMGRVRSEGRYIVRKDGRPCTFKPKMMRLGKGTVDMPYVTVTLRDINGESRTTTVHVLVLRAFVGPPPEGMEGCHGDNDPKNNRLGNLRWDTRSGNFADKRIHGTGTVGERHPQAKLTEAQVIEARQMRKRGTSVTQMAAHFGVSRMTASRAASGKSWSHVK